MTAEVPSQDGMALNYVANRSRLNVFGDPPDAVILAGDFNAVPSSASRRVFAAAGLTESAELAGHPAATPTYQWYGIRTRCLDGILLSSGWQVRHHHILDVKPGNTFPSDHFGVLADLTFRD